jgi:hypothetical protein
VTVLGPGCIERNYAKLSVSGTRLRTYVTMLRSDVGVSKATNISTPPDATKYSDEFDANK